MQKENVLKKIPLDTFFFFKAWVDSSQKLCTDIFLRLSIDYVLMKYSVNIYQTPIVGLILKLVFGEEKHKI